MLDLYLGTHRTVPRNNALALSATGIALARTSTPRFASLIPKPCIIVTFTSANANVTTSSLKQIIRPFFAAHPGNGNGKLNLDVICNFIGRSNKRLGLLSRPKRNAAIGLCLPHRTATVTTSTHPAFTTRAATDPHMPRKTQVLLIRSSSLIHHCIRDRLRRLNCQIIATPGKGTTLSLLCRRTRVSLLFASLIVPKNVSNQRLTTTTHRVHPSLGVLCASNCTSRTILPSRSFSPAVPLLDGPCRPSMLTRGVRRILGR